jgi:hypothetical protein
MSLRLKLISKIKNYKFQIIYLKHTIKEHLAKIVLMASIAQWDTILENVKNANATINQQDATRKPAPALYVLNI